MKWFKHDTDASIDAKLQELLLDYGAVGYGLYWYCVELIAKDVTPKNITFELDHDARIIARNLNLSVKEVNDIMLKIVDLGLFDISKNNKIACVKLAYRLDDSMRKGRITEEIINAFNRENPDKVGKIPIKSGKSLPEVEVEVEVEVDTELDLDLDLDLDLETDADKKPFAADKSAASKKQNLPATKQDKQETALQIACKETWRQYSIAYFNRYCVEPTRNAKVSSLIKSFVQRIGHVESPMVADFYVSHNERFYVQKLHPVEMLLKDAEGLRTQWATGMKMTQATARQVDSTQTNLNSIDQALAMLAERNANAK